MKTIIKLSVYFFLFILAYSCQQGPKGNTDTPTTGTIKIVVDETFSPISEAQVAVFQGIYKYAHINPIFLPENEAFKFLLRDSVRLLIASRKLTKAEEEYFHSQKIYPHQTLVAIDAVTLLVHPQNKDSLLSLKTIKDIFTGKIQNWNQISPSSKLGAIQVVFDNPNSSTLRFVVDSITKGEKLAKDLSALDYNKDVIDYVAKHPNSLGVIGVNWVSDRDDTTCLTFIKKARVVAISLEHPAMSFNSYKPYQAYIAQGLYPLRREIYAINADPRSGLAGGFAAFLASDRGQRIILKSGLLPATQPLRIIQVKEDL
ncbi:MAG: substrate-binding domain-containing protein [Bacteroidota bacterium]|nr:substrate-binding domain-containing protein [Bacteroidota bacterium]